MKVKTKRLLAALLTMAMMIGLFAATPLTVSAWTASAWVYYYDQSVLVHEEETYLGGTIVVENPNIVTARAGYLFLGWSDGSIMYYPGDMIRLEENLTLYAMWAMDDYQTKTLSYTVEYYLDGVLDTAETLCIGETVWINDPDTLTVQPVDISDYKYMGYRFDCTDPAPVPATIADGGVIKVYYVKRTDLEYTIEYYKDGLTSADYLGETTNIGMFGDCVILTEWQLDLMRPAGYTSGVQQDPVPYVIDISGNVIRVLYVKDYSQTKTLSCIVEYYLDGILHETLPPIYETVWVNDLDMLNVQPIDTSDYRYMGYRFDCTNPDPIPTAIEDGGVIRVYYIKDDEQTRDLAYTVRYTCDGVEVTSDAYTVTKQVWINDPVNVTVPVDAISAQNDRYLGYKLETNPFVPPAEARDGDVITVAYVKDASQTKTLSCTIEYYKGEALYETLGPIYKTVWINAPDTLTVQEIDTSDNRYAGYKFSASNPSSIPGTVDDGGVIKVYYVNEPTPPPPEKDSKLPIIPIISTVSVVPIIVPLLGQLVSSLPSLSDLLPINIFRGNESTASGSSHVPPPKTGDSADIAILALMVLAAAAIMGTAIIRRKPELEAE